MSKLTSHRAGVPTASKKSRFRGFRRKAWFVGGYVRMDYPPKCAHAHLARRRAAAARAISGAAGVTLRVKSMADLPQSVRKLNELADAKRIGKAVHKSDVSTNHEHARKVDKVKVTSGSQAVSPTPDTYVGRALSEGGACRPNHAGF